MTVAVLFPGEGFEYEGMGRPLHDTSAWRRVGEAKEITGVDATAFLLSSRDDDRFSVREKAIGLLAAGVVAYEHARASGLRPMWCAGYGVGRYSAFVASGVLDFESALRLLLTHLELLERSVRVTPVTTLFRSHDPFGHDLVLVDTALRMSARGDAEFDLEAVLEPVLPDLNCWNRWLASAPRQAAAFRAEAGKEFFFPLAHMAYATSAVNSPFEYVLTASAEDMDAFVRSARRDGNTVRRLPFWTGFPRLGMSDLSVVAKLVEAYARVGFHPGDAPALVGGNFPMALDEPSKTPLAYDGFRYEFSGFVDWRGVAYALRLMGAERYVLLTGSPRLLDVTQETTRQIEDEFLKLLAGFGDVDTHEQFFPIARPLPPQRRLAFEELETQG